MLHLTVRSSGPRDDASRALYKGIVQLLKRQGFTVARREGPGPGQCSPERLSRKLADLARESIVLVDFDEEPGPQRVRPRGKRA
jgi:hypothetical protein